MKNFNLLKYGDKIVSLIDYTIMQFRVDGSGDAYLCDDKSAYPLFQFDPNDFEKYDGNLDPGSVLIKLNSINAINNG